MIHAGLSPHARHRAIVDGIERECRVDEWRAGDVDLWPLAGQDLFLDIFREAGASTAAASPSLPIRAMTSLAAPVTNLWKSRHDLAHLVARPHRADFLFLGDGVSLDFVDGSWRDRFGEPVAAVLEAERRTCLFIQPGNLSRLPWARPTYAANRVAARGALVASMVSGRTLDLPDHPLALRLIEEAGVDAPSLSVGRLARRGRVVAAQAAAFESILRRVRPKVAFVVTYYAGLGHAFALACRRCGVLCVDLQHCPHDGAHRAYRWSRVPPRGYSTLPGLFWTWSEADAQSIRCWTDQLPRSWHRAITGGDTQIAGMSDEESDRLWEKAKALAGGGTFEREIMVALQPIGGKRDMWSALAKAIAAAPPTWRWWIRRHPASTPMQDKAYEPLLSLNGPKIVIGEAAQTALPALLGRMHALVSLASGAAGEAAIFGVPSFFLDQEALDTFPQAIEQGRATMAAIEALLPAIDALPASTERSAIGLPRIEDTLVAVDRMADEFRDLCRKDVSFRRTS